jgi:predicted permease
MILTGITISSIDVKKTFTDWRIYAASVIRLVVIPLAFVGIAHLLPVFEDKTLFTCALCALAMPLGINTIVVPSAYGKDTSDAAGMAVISHILAIGTIPVIFTLLG